MLEKFTNKTIMKTRIVAIALICIILSSSSLSVANGFTISLAVTEVNGKIIYNNLQKTNYKIYGSNFIDTYVKNCSGDMNFS